jgi:hypothetical protein
METTTTTNNVIVININDLSQQSEHPEHPEHPEHSEHSEQLEQLEHLEQSEQLEQLEQLEQYTKDNHNELVTHNIFEPSTTTTTTTTITTTTVTDNTAGFTMIDLTENANKPPISELDLVLYILKSDTDIKLLLNKLNYHLDNNTLQKLNHILIYFSQKNVKFNNSPPIKNIIDSIKEVFADGKLDLSDIPTLITVTNNILNVNLSTLKFKIDVNIISIVIKLVIHILIIQQVIKINEMDVPTINKLIDSSMMLLNTTITISNIKCKCFPSFGNK